MPTPTELRATLVTLVAGATDTPVGRWEKLIGDVEYLSLAFHPRSNWRVEVSGSEDDLRILNEAIDLLRNAEPYITRDKNPGE